MDKKTAAPVAVPVDASGLTLERRAELYDHMLAVAQANGYSSITEAISESKHGTLSPDDVLPADRRWTVAKAIGFLAEYRNCKAGETQEILQRFTGYMRAVLRDAAPAPHSGGSVSAREDAQRERMKERFADRVKSPATADFDLPAPNDAAPHSGEAATVETDARPYKKEPITKEWCENMARLEGDSEIGACEPAKYPRIFVDSAIPGNPLPENATYPASQLQICTSFEDGNEVFVIVRRAPSQHSVITDMGDSFASRSLAESALAKLSGKRVPDGTFACPICGKDTPHEHSSAEVAQHRIDRAAPEQAPIGEAGGVVATDMSEALLLCVQALAQTQPFIGLSTRAKVQEAIEAAGAALASQAVSGSTEEAQNALSDDWIELYATRHIAPHAGKFKAAFGLDAPYQQTEQFRRVKAYTHDVLRAAQQQAAPSELSDALNDILIEHRIALEPEHEGQWHADLYGEYGCEPIAHAEGSTPIDAARNAIAAAGATGSGA